MDEIGQDVDTFFATFYLYSICSATLIWKREYLVILRVRSVARRREMVSICDVRVGASGRNTNTRR